MISFPCSIEQGKPIYANQERTDDMHPNRDAILKDCRKGDQRLIVNPLFRL